MVCEAAKMLFSGDPPIGKQKNSFRVAGTKKKRLERSCRKVKYSPERHCAQNLINLMKKHALLVPDHVKSWNFQENQNRLDGICAKSFPPRNSDFPDFCKIHEKRPSGDAPDPLFSLPKSPLDPKRCKILYFTKIHESVHKNATCGKKNRKLRGMHFLVSSGATSENIALATGILMIREVILRQRASSSTKLQK